jgi:hypothetical protein
MHPLPAASGRRQGLCRGLRGARECPWGDHDFRTADQRREKVCRGRNRVGNPDFGLVGGEALIVLDNVFIDGEFKEQILLKGLGDSGRGRSMVLDGEMVRVLSILSQESKKPSFLNSKDLLEVFSFNLIP